MWHLEVAAIPQRFLAAVMAASIQDGVGRLPVKIVSSLGQFFSVALSILLRSLTWSHLFRPSQKPKTIHYPFHLLLFCLVRVSLYCSELRTLTDEASLA